MELTSGFVLNMEYPNWESIAPKLMVKEDTI